MLSPSIDAALDITDASETLRAQVLGDAQTATAVVAMDEQVLVARQHGQLLGDLAHGNRLRAGDATDGALMRLTHIDEPRLSWSGGEEALGFCNGEF